jgi:glycerol uptake facilitator protein
MYTNFFIGELLGSLFMILFGGGVVAAVLLKNSKGEHGGWISITAGWGFAVMIGIYVAQACGSPQADLNPIVTIAKYYVGIYNSFPHIILIIIAELIGCFLGAIFVWLAYLPHWKPTTSPRLKLVIFSTSPEIKNIPGNFICEVIASMALIIIVGVLIKYDKYQHFADGELPYIFGMVVWAIGLSLGGPTGYAINPARDLGPRIAHFILPIAGKGSSEWHYAWVPIVAPIVGCILGVFVIKLFILA